MAQEKKDRRLGTQKLSAKLHLAQDGYSLLNVLVGVGIAAIVSIGAMSLMQETFQWNFTASVQTEMDRSHYISVLRAKNPDYITDLIGLNSTTDPDLAIKKQCLTRQASTIEETKANMNCAYQFGNWRQAIPNPAPPVQKVFGGVDLVTEYWYRATCTYTACSELTMQVVTMAKQGSQDIGTKNASAAKRLTYKRESIFSIPSYMFSNIAQYKFECAQLSGAKQIITGVTTDRLEARCDSLLDVGICNSYGPLLGLDPKLKCSSVSPAPPSLQCANGFTSAGMKATDPVCISAPINLQVTTSLTATCPRDDRKVICGCDSASLTSQLSPLYSGGYMDSPNQVTGVVLPTCGTQPGVCRAVECSLPTTTGTTTPITPTPSCLPGVFTSSMLTPQSSPYSWSPDSVGATLYYIRQLRGFSTSSGFPSPSNIDQLETTFKNFVTAQLKPATAGKVGSIVGSNSDMSWNFMLSTGSMGGNSSTSAFVVLVYIQLSSNPGVCP